MMMKMVKMAVIAAALALSVTAVGAGVIINHAGPTPLTCTLTGSGMITNPNGQITMYCAEDLGSGGVSTCTNQRPTISVVSPPVSATVGTQVTAQVSYADPEGQAVTVTPNVGTVAGSTWSWTPAASGTQTVTLTATDGQTCNNASSTSFSVNVTGGGTVPGGNAELLTPVKGTEVYAQQRTIGALATKYYYFVLPGPEAGGKSSYYVQVSMGTWDWSTNQDMVVKLNALPTAADIVPGLRMKSGPDVWYKISAGACFGTGVGGSNEMVQMLNVPPGTYYVMVTNTCSVVGKFSLYYSAQ